MLLALFVAMSAAPVWIASDSGSGMLISWTRSPSHPIALFVETGKGGKVYPLDRPGRSIFVATPSPPYRIGYQVEGGPVVTLAEAGQWKSRTPRPPDEFAAQPYTRKPKPREPKVQVAVNFNSRFERALLLAPVPPDEVRRALQAAPKTVDLFIKVNPSGKVTGTSSPYYSDAIHRELARIAATTAMERWRFERSRTPQYRDGRLQLVFARHRTTIRTHAE